MTTTWNDLTLSINFSAQIQCTAVSPDATRIDLTWDNAVAEKPVMEIKWSMPLLDIQTMWQPKSGKNRSLRADWDSPQQANLSNGAPVFCFMNQAGRSRLTIALSDAVTNIGHAYGVHEEDATLICRVVVPMEMIHAVSSYSLTLLRITDDMPYEDAIRRVSRWWETDCGLVPMPVPDIARLPLYSTWYSYHQETIAKDLEDECALAAQDGFRAVIVDDGWQTSDCSRGYGYCGDWQVAPEKIPDMRAHVEKIHALGMQYMLWYSVVFVGKFSQHWHEFENMLLREVPDLYAGVLDPRFPQVRTFLINTYLKALKEWNLDGFKLDFIDSFTPAGFTPPPRREGMDYALVEDAVLRLMTDIKDALTAVKPDILIEFRQRYIGPCMRTFGNMFRVTDCPADWLSNRVGMVDLRLLSGNTAVHSDMLMWHEQDSVENAACQLLNIFFAVPQISVRLAKMPDDHHKMLRYYMNWMTRKRHLLQAPIQAEAPHALYPVVRTRLADEEAVVVYEQNKIVTPSDAQTCYLFNASLGQEVLLRNDGRTWAWEIINCMGESVSTCESCSDSLIMLTIPSGGHAELRCKD